MPSSLTFENRSARRLRAASLVIKSAASVGSSAFFSLRRTEPLLFIRRRRNTKSLPEGHGGRVGAVINQTKVCGKIAWARLRRFLRLIRSSPTSSWIIRMSEKGNGGGEEGRIYPDCKEVRCGFDITGKTFNVSLSSLVPLFETVSAPGTFQSSDFRTLSSLIIYTSSSFFARASSAPDEFEPLQGIIPQLIQYSFKLIRLKEFCWPSCGNCLLSWVKSAFMDDPTLKICFDIKRRRSEAGR